MHKRLASFFIENATFLVDINMVLGRSIPRRWLDIIDEISESVDNKHFSIGLFLDLSNAFDTINHRIRLNKFNIYGVWSVALEWFLSHLTNGIKFAAIGADW